MAAAPAVVKIPAPMISVARGGLTSVPAWAGCCRRRGDRPPRAPGFEPEPANRNPAALLLSSKRRCSRGSTSKPAETGGRWQSRAGAGPASKRKAVIRGSRSYRPNPVLLGRAPTRQVKCRSTRGRAISHLSGRFGRRPARFLNSMMRSQPRAPVPARFVSCSAHSRAGRTGAVRFGHKLQRIRDQFELTRWKTMYSLPGSERRRAGGLQGVAAQGPLVRRKRRRNVRSFAAGSFGHRFSDGKVSRPGGRRCLGESTRRSRKARIIGTKSEVHVPADIGQNFVGCKSIDKRDGRAIVGGFGYTATKGGIDRANPCTNPEAAGTISG